MPTSVCPNPTCSATVHTSAATTPEREERCGVCGVVYVSARGRVAEYLEPGKGWRPVAKSAAPTRVTTTWPASIACPRCGRMTSPPERGNNFVCPVGHRFVPEVPPYRETSPAPRPKTALQASGRKIGDACARLVYLLAHAGMETTCKH